MTTPYVEAAEKALECYFRAFEIVNATYVAEGTPVPVPKLSTATAMVIKETIQKVWRPGYGLGKNLQGIKKALVIPEHKERYGLGGYSYKPMASNRKRTAGEKKRRK